MRKENSSPHYNKTPSWDGTVFVYKSEKTKKDNLAGRVPIQIKGTEKLIVSDTAAFSCSIADLKNYYKDGSCIFFLISVDLSSGNSRIFYKTLLVVDLDKIIKGAGNIMVYNGPPVRTTHEKIIVNQIIPYQPILSPEPPCYRSAQRNCPAEQGCLDRLGLAGTMSQVRCPQLLNPLRTLAAAAQPARTRLSRSVACDAKQLW